MQVETERNGEHRKWKWNLRNYKEIEAVSVLYMYKVRIVANKGNQNLIECFLLIKVAGSFDHTVVVLFHYVKRIVIIEECYE